jgi:hypothetical protein
MWAGLALTNQAKKSTAFLKKKQQKTLRVLSRTQMETSFLVLFFKKGLLPFLVRPTAQPKGAVS